MDLCQIGIKINFLFFLKKKIALSFMNFDIKNETEESHFTTNKDNLNTLNTPRAQNETLGPLHALFLLSNKANAKAAAVMFVVFLVLLFVFASLVHRYHNSGYYITGIVFSAVALFIPLIRVASFVFISHEISAILFWRTFYFTWEVFFALSALFLFIKSTSAIAFICIMFIFAVLLILSNTRHYVTYPNMLLVVLSTVTDDTMPSN